MIRATMDWRRLRLEIEGHAGYAEKGKDIVCAGASAICGALTAALEEAEARGRCAAGRKEGNGALTVWADPTMGSMTEIKAYFRMTVKGLEGIQEEYPEYMKVQEVK